MSEVTISFVVPAYNEEALIASCLYAILAETSRIGRRGDHCRRQQQYTGRGKSQRQFRK